MDRYPGKGANRMLSRYLTVTYFRRFTKIRPIKIFEGWAGQTATAFNRNSYTLVFFNIATSFTPDEKEEKN